MSHGMGVGSGYATVPHDTVDKVVSFMGMPQLIRSAVLLLLFVFAVFNRKIWFAADMLLTGVAGLVLLLAPQLLLDFQIARSTLDGVDVQLGRMIGCVLIGNAVLWCLATKFTKDPDTVHPALLLTRVITNGVLLIAMIDIQLFSKSWNSEHITFGMLGTLLWLIGNVAHLMHGGYPGGHLQRQRPVNNFLLFDFALSVFVGFAMFGFPRWFLRNFTLVRTLDGAHEHLTRAFGTMIFGTGLFAFQAVGFQYDKDKEAHFIQRLTINVLLFLATLYAQIFYHKEWNLIHCWAVQFFIILWSIHAYLGWKADPYAVRVPRKIITREREVTRSFATSGTRSPGGLRQVADYGEYDRED